MKFGQNLQHNFYARFFMILVILLALFLPLSNALSKPAKTSSKITSKAKSTQSRLKQPKNTSATKDSTKHTPSANDMLKLTLTPADIEKISKNYKNPQSLFVGAGLGIGLQFIKSSDSANTSVSTTNTLDIGFRAGYQYMPLDYIGLRIYLDYFLSIRPIGLESETSSTFLANFNAQGRIYAFTRNVELGWVGGLSIGYGTHQNQISSEASNESSEGNYGRGIFLGNVGIFGIIDKHHRVEILAKIPIISFANTNNQYAYEDYSFLFMYDYLF